MLRLWQYFCNAVFKLKFHIKSRFPPRNEKFWFRLKNPQHYRKFVELNFRGLLHYAMYLAVTGLTSGRPRLNESLNLGQRCAVCRSFSDQRYGQGQIRSVYLCYRYTTLMFNCTAYNVWISQWWIGKYLKGHGCRLFLIQIPSTNLRRGTG